MRPMAILLIVTGVAVLAASYVLGPYSRSNADDRAGAGETAPSAGDRPRIVSAGDSAGR